MMVEQGPLREAIRVFATTNEWAGLENADHASGLTKRGIRAPPAASSVRHSAKDRNVEWREAEAQKFLVIHFAKPLTNALLSGVRARTSLRTRLDPFRVRLSERTRFSIGECRMVMLPLVSSIR
jgi:hypothetical protein